MHKNRVRKLENRVTPPEERITEIKIDFINTDGSVSDTIVIPIEETHKVKN